MFTHTHARTHTHTHIHTQACTHSISSMYVMYVLILYCLGAPNVQQLNCEYTKVLYCLMEMEII